VRLISSHRCLQQEMLEQESLIASEALDRAEAAEAELLQLRHQLVGCRPPTHAAPACGEPCSCRKVPAA
jgi:hypothetical protein